MLDVQDIVNNSPTSALGGMTPSQALYGTLPANVTRPPTEALVELLGFERCAADRALPRMCLRPLRAPACTCGPAVAI